MKNRLSALTLIAMMGVLLYCTTVFYPRHKQWGSNATIAWDAAGYYWYLPSIFIYHDLAEQRWADSLIKDYGPGPVDVSGFGFRTENGNIVMKYPAGMAVVESPFFFAAHLLARPLGYAADGFSKPYQAAIQFGALAVAFLGLWLLRRLLLYYYRDGVVAICLLVLVVGTNYLNYSAIDGSISHSWLFTLYVGLMLCTRSFFLKPTKARAAGIGALCGLATLIRPTEIIACIIPLLWGLEEIRLSSIKARIAFLWSLRFHLLLAALAGAGFIVIQLIYWKSVSGHWLVYSYQDQGFSWLHPHVWDYTFSYRSGWITYTPVMILALAGLIPFLRRGPNRVMIMSFAAAAFYLVTAWDVWWYAGMGGRAMIQYYPALFFLMAALFEWLSRSSIRILVATPFVLLGMYINIWFTWHAHAGSLYDADGGMSRAYYWRVIGRWNAPTITTKLKDGPYLYEGAIPPTAQLVYSNSLRNGSNSSPLLLDSVHQASPFYRFGLKFAEGAHWLRASAVFHIVEREPAVWQMTQFNLNVRRNNAVIREGMIRVQRFADEGARKRLSVDIRLPSVSSGDSADIHFLNVESDKRVEISDLEVYAF